MPLMIKSVVLPVSMTMAVCSAEADSLSRCTPLMFDASGHAKIHDQVPDVLPLCYSFSARNAQHAHVKITEDNNVTFDISSIRSDDLPIPVASDERVYDFVTEAKTYRILAGASVRHGNTAASFTLEVTLQ